MPLKTGTRLGPYDIRHALGAGGMGEVYRAHDSRLNRDVALKLLPDAFADDPDRLARFRREAQVLASLNHPHIAQIHGLEDADGRRALVMELVEGPTLANRLAQGPLPVDEVLGTASQLAEALEAAHDRGIVHRDLKPANIKVQDDGTVKVLDFGLAKPMDPAAAASPAAAAASTVTVPGITRSGMVLGTPAYMAPEQVRGRPVDRRADLWAFGCVVFEMLTGVRPFGGDEVADTLVSVLTQEPAWSMLPVSLPANVGTLLRRCLEKDPRRRLDSARAARLEIEEAQAGARGGTTPAAAAVPVPAGWWATHWRLALVAGAVVLGLATLALWRRPAVSLPSSAPGAIESIVALPSTVFAPEADRFLTDAIPNTISTYLAQVPGLDTKVPPSSAELARVGDDPNQVAAAYGVGAFVLSSVTVDGDRLVLNLQLVDAGSQRLLWSNDFDGRRADYLGLAREAAEQLRAVVRPATAHVTARVETSSSEAELAYQQGLHHANRYNYQHHQEDFDLALAAYERALQTDPRMAQAAADVAWLYEFKLEARSPPDDTLLPEMERWGRRAIALDPNNSRAWAALAVVAMANSDVEQALQTGITAASKGPRDAYAFNALGGAMYCCSAELALASIQEAIRIDPLYLYPSLNASELLSELGRPAQALTYADGILRIEPDMPLALTKKALVLIDMGRHGEAAALLAPLRAMVKDGRVPATTVSMIEDGVALAGTPQERTRALDHLVQVNLGAGYNDEYPPVYVWLLTHGRVDGTLATMEARARAGRVPYDFLRLRPEFHTLAGDPRFARILDVSRRQFGEMLAVIDQARSRGEFPAVLEHPLAQLRAKLGETK